MSFNLKNFLLFFVVFVPALSSAHVHKIVHMQDDKGQDLYLFDECYTYENGNNTVNTQQRKDFIELAQQLNAAVIAQDYHIYNTSALSKNFAQYDNNHYSCLATNLLNCNRQKTFLDMLSAWCHHAQLPVINAEFRFCTDANNLQEVENLCERITKEIAHYQDGPLLSTIYKNTLEQCADTLAAELDCARTFFDQNNSSMIEKILFKFFSSERRKHFFNEVDKALRPLFDMRVLHALKHHYNDQKTVFIAVWYHMDKLRTHLTQLGYQIVNETKDNYRTSYSYDLFDALNIREVFQTWGITIETQKQSIANRILTLKNYIEQKKLDYILNDLTLIGLPLAFVLSRCAHAIPLNNHWAKLLIMLALINPCFNAIDSVLSMPIVRKDTQDIFAAIPTN